MKIPFLLMLIFCGCSFIDKEKDIYGRLYYIDGAGNWGFGTENIKSAAKELNYPGNVIMFNWTISFNPLIDQTIGRNFARTRAQKLAQEINQYNNEVIIVSLSAGTGVAIWACEELHRPINQVFLLSSSLSTNYNPQKALKNIHQLFVYCSKNDKILSGPVKTIGTIDGQINSSCVGEVGFSYQSEKIIQVNWSKEYEKYGWNGSHISSVNKKFLVYILKSSSISQE